MEINWSPRSLIHLQRIYHFYVEHASERVAKSIIQRIIDRTQLLAFSPFSGVVEEQLANRIYQYRFLVYRHFKIYYFVTADLVEIAGVFDCRQDPDKLLELL